MSENIDCNLSMGVSETGTIGQDIIVGILSVEKEDEINLLINNLNHSQHIINLSGYPTNDSKTTKNQQISQEYIAHLIRNKSLNLAIFRLQPKEQFKLLKEISILECQRLYEMGKALDASNYQYIGKALQLRYQHPKVFLDTFMKSIIQYMALNWLLKQSECSHSCLFAKNIDEERRMALHIIVDGGPNFSSYQDLLNDNLKNYWSEIKTNASSTFYWNLMVATHGISNAKYYYPVVSSIDYITANINNSLNNFIYSSSIFHDITANQILEQKDHIGKSLLEVLHDLYLERTGSTFRPPKLWRIGNFENLGEYELTLPYLMLQKSIKEKRITAREIDDDVNNIERFYQYNNPLDRDAFIVGEINGDDEKRIIDYLNDLGIEGTTIKDDSLIEEYENLLDVMTNKVESEDCIISNSCRKDILTKITKFKKKDFKNLKKIKIPANIFH